MYRDIDGDQWVNGMTMEDLSIAERVFETNIQVDSLVLTEEDRQNPDDEGVVVGVRGGRWCAGCACRTGEKNTPSV